MAQQRAVPSSSGEVTEERESEKKKKKKVKKIKGKGRKEKRGTKWS